MMRQPTKEEAEFFKKLQETTDAKEQERLVEEWLKSK